MKLIEDTWLVVSGTPIAHSIPLYLTPQEEKKLKHKTHSDPKEVPLLLWSPTLVGFRS
jgi:hypothetical protein